MNAPAKETPARQDAPTPAHRPDATTALYLHMGHLQPGATHREYCALATAACLCFILTAGCLVPPIPKDFHTHRTVLAVRYNEQGAPIERLIKQESEMWYVGGMSAITAEPPGGISEVWYAKRVYVDRTNHSKVRFESLERVQSDKSYWDWFAREWHFRPIGGTNLWTALHGPCQLYRWHSADLWDKDIDFRVYVIAPNTLSVKSLTTFASPGRLGFPELVFDPENRHLTYNTRHGYETYDLLEDTITPAGRPQESQALAPRDFGFADTSNITKVLGTNYTRGIKVEGPVDQYSRSTNSFTISLHTFTPDKLVHQQVVSTRGFADIHHLNINAATGVVTYKSGDDEFTYHALENRLDKNPPP